VLRCADEQAAAAPQGEPGHAHSAAALRSLGALLVGRVCERAQASSSLPCEPPAPGVLDGGAAMERACGVDPRRGMVFQARHAACLGDV
jgi:hypothetical protein